MGITADVFLVVQKEGKDFSIVDYSVRIPGEENLMKKEDEFYETLDIAIAGLGAERIEMSKINVASRDFNEIRWDPENQVIAFYHDTSVEGEKVSQDIFRNKEGMLVEMSSFVPPNYQDEDMVLLRMTDLTKMLSEEELKIHNDTDQIVAIEGVFSKEEDRIFGMSVAVSEEIDNLTYYNSVFPASVHEMDDGQEAHITAKLNINYYTYEGVDGTEHDAKSKLVDAVVEFHPFGTYERNLVIESFTPKENESYEDYMSRIESIESGSDLPPILPLPNESFEDFLLRGEEESSKIERIKALAKESIKLNLSIDPAQCAAFIINI